MKCQQVRVRVKQVLLHVDGWATRIPRHTYLLKMLGDSRWPDVSVPAVKAFIGLIINMGALSNVVG
jgi:hypothetical protein